jgi:DNA repair exonuclease SbcCD ATPase subunit
MNKITFFKLKTLTLTGFRCFAEQTAFSFDDVTLISGSNGTGKTTIAHAVAFAFYGLTFFGEQAIGRLRNFRAKRVEVTVTFEDQNAQAHTLSRSRAGDKTTLTLDGCTVRQADIDARLCDKDVFLSLFNPLYFIERIAGDGREFLQKYLPVLEKAEVLEGLSEHGQSLLSGISFGNPGEAIDYYRKEIREAKSESDNLSGQLELLTEQAAQKDARYAAARRKLETAQTALARLTEKQFDGIDADALNIQKSALTDALRNRGALDGEITAAKTKISTIKARQYDSPYKANFAGLDMEIKALRKQHAELTARLSAVRIGDQCPYCYVKITPQGIAQVKAQLQADLDAVTAKGKNLVGQQTELLTLEKQSKEKFEQFKNDDVQKAGAALAELESRRASGGRENLQAEIRAIDETLQYGNLSEDQLSELSALRADVTAYAADLRALDAQNPQAGMETVKVRLAGLEVTARTFHETVFALQAYAAKRAELSLAALTMPNVQIQLYDVIKSTGEVRDAFHFTYKGTDYRSLSLSEKVKAGLEASALMRRLTGLEYPIFIDNTESIAALDRNVLPAQVFLSKVVKGAALSVTANANPQPLKKAG